MTQFPSEKVKIIKELEEKEKNKIIIVIIQLIA